MKLLQLSWLLFLIGFLPTNVHAQHFSAGGGVAYNATVETPGLNLRGYYNKGEHFCFGPEFTYFFPKNETHGDEAIKTSVWEINFNAHYIFEVNERLGVYPLFGFNYTKEKEAITYLSKAETKEESVDAFGVNLGAGLHVPLPKFTPFIEYEYVASNLSEHVITLGFFVNLGKKDAVHEEHKQ